MVPVHAAVLLHMGIDFHRAVSQRKPPLRMALSGNEGRQDVAVRTDLRPLHRVERHAKNRFCRDVFDPLHHFYDFRNRVFLVLREKTKK